jgi:hypothetical protein
MLKFYLLVFTALILTACMDVLFDEDGGVAGGALYQPHQTPAAGKITAFVDVTPQIMLYLYIGMPRGTEIWYTTDGSTPHPGTGMRYVPGRTGPFTIPLAGVPTMATLKAITHKNGWVDSSVLTAVWTLDTSLTAWRDIANSPFTNNTNAVCYGYPGGSRSTQY